MARGTGPMARADGAASCSGGDGGYVRLVPGRKVPSGTTPWPWGRWRTLRHRRRSCRGMPDPVPVVVLARLGLDRSEQGNKLGGHLLVDALRRAVQGAEEFGARAVVVDAIDDQAAAFYRHFGFHELEGHRSWRRLEDITQALSTPPSPRH